MEDTALIHAEFDMQNLMCLWAYLNFFFFFLMQKSDISGFLNDCFISFSLFMWSYSG